MTANRPRSFISTPYGVCGKVRGKTGSFSRIARFLQSKPFAEALFLPVVNFQQDELFMQNDAESRTRKDLSAEIEALDKRYQTIKDYLAGAEMEDFEIAAALRAYKDDLSAISAHVLTLYQLKGQRTKITWDSLFTNIDTALEIIQNSRQAKSRAAIEAALNMSEPKIGEIMAYLAALRKTL